MFESMTTNDPEHCKYLLIERFKGLRESIEAEDKREIGPAGVSPWKQERQKDN
jgi:hypothetical protein